MEYNPIHSNADESPGKYQEDKPLLFRDLLSEQTEADRDPLKYRPRTTEPSPKHPEEQTAASREESASHTKSPQTDSSSTKSPRAAVPRESLLKQYLSDRPADTAYGESTTDHANPRYYTLQRQKIDDQAYYCLLCEEYQSGLAGKVALIEVGTGLAFEAVSFTLEVLTEAIEAQRRADFRAGTRPVPRLRTAQLEALNQAYQRIVEAQLSRNKEHAESEYREARPIEIYDRFAFATDTAPAIHTEVLDATLIPQQRAVVEATFVKALHANSGIPDWVWRQNLESQFPAIAAIHLLMTPDRTSD